MENRRFILLAVLGVLIFFIYQSWQTEHGPKPVLTPPDTVAAEATQARIDADVPTIGGPAEAVPGNTPGLSESRGSRRRRRASRCLPPSAAMASASPQQHAGGKSFAYK